MCSCGYKRFTGNCDSHSSITVFFCENVHDFVITRNVGTLLTLYYSIPVKRNDNFNMYNVSEIDTFRNQLKNYRYLSYHTHTVLQLYQSLYSTFFFLLRKLVKK